MSESDRIARPVENDGTTEKQAEVVVKIDQADNRLHEALAAIGHRST